ncbi:MAG: hypothetical protein ACE5KM_00770 [Planctomycetaceae bacterium]
MNFAQRHPSETWEAVPLAGTPQQFVWAWFKPVNLPQGLFLRIPDEVRKDPATAQRLTMRNLLHSAGVDAATVSAWHLYGTACDGVEGTNPVLDQPVPPPPPGVDPNIAVVMANRPAPAVVPAANPAVVGGPASTPAAGVPPAAALYERIEVDWQASQTLESQLTSLRRQLADLHGRLNALNRDLSPEERLHGERKDKSDWLIARRWLRDFALRISRCIKMQDIGDATYAGRRAWFEDTYNQRVAPRLPVDELEQTQREYEGYRKLVQSQYTNANAVFTAAKQDGERRAREILNRIASSVRSARAKR